MYKKYLSALLFILLSSSVFGRITGTLPSADDALCRGASGSEVCTDASGNEIPTTDDNQDLGTSSLRWKNLYLSGTTTSSGDLTVTGTLDLTGSLNVTGDTSLDGALTVNDSGADKDVIMEGDTDTALFHLDAGNDRVGIGTATPAVLFDVDGVFNATQITINEAGADLDSRIEGDTDANLLYTDAGNDRVGVGTATPATLLDVAGVFSSTSFIINEAAADLDSRIEGDTDANLFYTDASTDRVGIGTATPSTKLDVQGTFNITGTTTIEGAVTINDSGADVDFRVEGDTNANMLVVDAGDDTVSVGGGTGIKEILTATDTLDFPSITSQTDEDLTITVTGSAVGDACHLGLPAAPTANLAWNCFVSATNTVTVRVHNYTGGAVDPASATYRVVTFGY
jgi:cytoskeletal protein CcmA (bactofilin family)